jgi:uncharacterized protein involved in exopolysaccharide biosynthesis
MTAAQLEARRLYLAFLPSRLRQIRPPENADLIAAADHIDAQAAEIAALKKATVDLVKERNSVWDEFGAMRDQIVALKAELATARESALEEAALALESEENEPQWGEDRNTRTAKVTVAECAKIVRALKGQTP